MKHSYYLLKKTCSLFLIFMITSYTIPSFSQTQSLVNTSASPYAKLYSTNISDVHWTRGFWADRFNVCKDTMIYNMWRLFSDPILSHAFENFRIAAKIDTGSFSGPPFMDGDFYKWIEATAAVYNVTRSPALNKLMDSIIFIIAKAQRSDGYIQTQVLINDINHPKNDSVSEFNDSLSFEEYNMGHLMTAGCIHYRATGKKTLLNIAEKAAVFLNNYYTRPSSSLIRSAVCPSHYMGLVELYRTTHNKAYLTLAEKLFNMRDSIKGTDQNQDRIPFRMQRKAVGHAVRANYLYAGAADLFMENGDSTLLVTLDSIWEDLVTTKMYVTGGCGALYDGVSPDGTSYSPAEIQQVHQAYGRPYQLPNFTAHDETCANIGNVLWNWRMLQISGNSQYADVLEETLYNSVLSGISLDGKSFLYSNPLAYNSKLPYRLRWSEKPRDPYIGLSFCCPPNVVRIIAEADDYMYSISREGLWFNLYGGNNLRTHLKDGSSISLVQETDYPWNGLINITLKETPVNATSMFFRIPNWCTSPSLKINGVAYTQSIKSGSYLQIERRWKEGDKIELNLPMHVQLITSNPLVEETRNQVAVKRGPIIYCLESADLPKDVSIFNIALSPNTKWNPEPSQINHFPLMKLQTQAKLIASTDWKNKLYEPLQTNVAKNISITMIPYYSWENRGKHDMEVWIPLRE